jgi:hypothetical protein
MKNLIVEKRLDSHLPKLHSVVGTDAAVGRINSWTNSSRCVTRLVTRVGTFLILAEKYQTDLSDLGEQRADRGPLMNADVTQHF